MNRLETKNFTFSVSLEMTKFSPKNVLFGNPIKVDGKAAFTKKHRIKNTGVRKKKTKAIV